MTCHQMSSDKSVNFTYQLMYCCRIMTHESFLWVWILSPSKKSNLLFYNSRDIITLLIFLKQLSLCQSIKLLWEVILYAFKVVHCSRDKHNCIGNNTTYNSCNVRISTSMVIRDFKTGLGFITVELVFQTHSQLLLLNYESNLKYLFFLSFHFINQIFILCLV